MESNDYSTIPTKDELSRIDTEIEKSRKRLYLTIVFRSVIGAVVFRNEVTNEDYSPAYLDSELHGTFDTEGITPDETHFIVLSPGARDADVIKALQEYREQLGNVKGVPKYKYIHQVWEVNKNKPSLKKFRNWYKAIKNGSSPADIAENETKDCPIYSTNEHHPTGKNKPKGCTCYSESMIRKGFDIYESLVWKTRTS
ncbi:MAG TPA: hypothetical protein VE090_02080 [Methylomirabilota bacterium]|nr:hypothetical protein [Methylomirabilota bacterium]